PCRRLGSRQLIARIGIQLRRGHHALPYFAPRDSKSTPVARQGGAGRRARNRTRFPDTALAFGFGLPSCHPRLVLPILAVPDPACRPCWPCAGALDPRCARRRGPDPACATVPSPTPIKARRELQAIADPCRRVLA